MFLDLDLPTLTRETPALISTGVLPRDAFDGPVPDSASDSDTELAPDDEEDGQYLAMAKTLIQEEADNARRLRALVELASDDEEDGQCIALAKLAIEEEADKARRLRMLADYASDDDDEDEGRQSNADNEPAAADEDVDEVPGPSAATNHVHYDDDVIVITRDSSSSGSGSPFGTNSDRSSSPERFDDQDEQLARDEEKRQQRIAAAKEKLYSPTPDVDGIPHFASEDIDMSSAHTLSLEHKSDDEILAGFFGEGHGAVLSNIRPTPPTTSPGHGQHAPPAPPAPAPTERMVIRPELAKRLEEVTRPRNLLKRTMNGDAYIADGAGGFMSARTGRHVDRAFASDLVQRQEENTLRSLAQMIDAGQVIVTVVEDQPAAPTSPGSDDSNSQDADSVDEQLDACSSSDEEVPTRKRAREDEEDEDEASSEKRRRVQSEEQPGSRAVLRLRSRAPSPSPAPGSSTAATQTDIHIHTATAAAPPTDGAAVVEPTQHAANGSDETPVASTSVLAAAEPAQEAVPSANVPARRSTRIRDVAEVKAAEEARRAAEAAPVPKRRGNGKGKGGA